MEGGSGSERAPIDREAPLPAMAGPAKGGLGKLEGRASGSSLTRNLLLLLLTSLFFICGLLFDYMPQIIDGQIKRQVELATNLELRELWAKPPVLVVSHYWLYDITNAE